MSKRDAEISLLGPCSCSEASSSSACRYLQSRGLHLPPRRSLCWPLLPVTSAPCCHHEAARGTGGRRNFAPPTEPWSLRRCFCCAPVERRAPCLRRANSESAPRSRHLGPNARLDGGVVRAGKANQNPLPLPVIDNAKGKWSGAQGWPRGEWHVFVDFRVRQRAAWPKAGEAGTRLGQSSSTGG